MVLGIFYTWILLGRRNCSYLLSIEQRKCEKSNTYAPVDFSKDNTILANWSRVIDSDQIVDEFGHLDGQVLDIGFLMRNPPRYTFDKYLKLFKR
jgi:hypothetical protein